MRVNPSGIFAVLLCGLHPTMVSLFYGKDPLAEPSYALRIAEVNLYASFSVLSFEESASLTCMRLVERRDRKSDWSSV